ALHRNITIVPMRSLLIPLCNFLKFSFFFSSRRRHTRSKRDWSSDVCSSDLACPHSFSQVAPLLSSYRTSKVRHPSSVVHGPCSIPGGRQAKSPAENVVQSRRSVIEPSRMYTSSQKSWVRVPFALVSVPGAKRKMRVTTPGRPLSEMTRSSSPGTFPSHGVHATVSTGANSLSSLAMYCSFRSSHSSAVRQLQLVRGGLQRHLPVLAIAELVAEQGHCPAEEDQIVLSPAGALVVQLVGLGERSHCCAVARLVGPSVQVGAEAHLVPCSVQLGCRAAESLPAQRLGAALLGLGDADVCLSLAVGVVGAKRQVQLAAQPQ